MKNKYFLLFFLFLFSVGPVFASKIIPVQQLDIPDEVEFFDEDGNKVFLDQFENKTILLLFWATWCSSCVKEMPDLDVLQKDFRKLPFEVIAVSEDFHGVNVVKDYFKRQGIRHLKIYHDHKNRLFQAFSVIGLPTAFLINRDSKIVSAFLGGTNWYDEEVRELILSQIPGNHAMPKNSYDSNSLNRKTKAGTPNNNEKKPAELHRSP